MKQKGLHFRIAFSPMYDESWMHHYNPETKRIRMEWRRSKFSEDENFREIIYTYFNVAYYCELLDKVEAAFDLKGTVILTLGKLT